LCNQTRSLAAAVCVAPLAGIASGACSAAERPSLHAGPTRGYIVISRDTLRADHLGLYGYERDTSPFLDRLAQRVTVFDRAIVQLPGTLPSHTLSAPDCDSPARLGVNEDERCLSFFVSGAALARTRLYDLQRDPAATAGVAGDRPQLYAQMLDGLAGRSFETAAAPGARALDEEQLRRLPALGYIR
jgi:hypothetical protein